MICKILLKIISEVFFNDYFLLIQNELKYLINKKFLFQEIKSHLQL